ncbi:hypothetical protein RJT34_04849 [Clitoria ternatea]|uniref:40S ribosomal protein S16 n=1 Tax=Clitoria ternatea TaxID=43366 RepID=A0AAN9KM16_CLITE
MICPELGSRDPDSSQSQTVSVVLERRERTGRPGGPSHRPNALKWANGGVTYNDSPTLNSGGRRRRRSRRIQKMAQAIEQVQCFGRKKTAVAVTYCKRGRGLIKINGCPIELVEPEILRFKAFEPILLLGRHRFAGVDMRIRVKGGGHTSQIYAIRQSIAKALVAFYQKYVDEQSKKEIKDILVRYDRTLLVADPRRCEPKKFGGRGARARFQKSYR